MQKELSNASGSEGVGSSRGRAAGFRGRGRLVRVWAAWFLRGGGGGGGGRAEGEGGGELVEDRRREDRGAELSAESWLSCSRCKVQERWFASQAARSSSW